MADVVAPAVSIEQGAGAAEEALGDAVLGKS
jgi:hypothetical protein